ncbi:hypothetical protein SKAU_G00060950, partial [Synaphobranchus kaupii]
DGSANRNPDTGDSQVGYAVVTLNETLESARLPGHLSAQAAELFALTRACHLAKGKVVNIHTDSRYAFGVVHDFGTLWKHRGFLTSAGKAIQNGSLVESLLDAILLPKGIAVCKCAAHTKCQDDTSKGNDRADVAAKAAAQATKHTTLQMLTQNLPQTNLPQAPEHTIAECQTRASPSEKLKWAKWAKKEGGVWYGKTGESSSAETRRGSVPQAAAGGLGAD